MCGCEAAFWTINLSLFPLSLSERNRLLSLKEYVDAAKTIGDYVMDLMFCCLQQVSKMSVQQLPLNFGFQRQNCACRSSY